MFVEILQPSGHTQTLDLGRPGKYACTECHDGRLLLGEFGEYMKIECDKCHADYKFLGVVPDADTGFDSLLL